MLNHLERLFEAQSIEEIWSLHVKKMASYGFDRLLYGYTRFRTSHSFGHFDDMVVLSNHDQAYLDGFLHGGLYTQAPMVNWSAENEGAASWRMVEDMLRAGTLTPSELRVLEFNRRFDIVAGYSISFQCISPRSKGAIGLVAPSGVTQREVDAIWERHGREITVINNVTHMRLISLPFVSQRRALTQRQREVLEWVGDGKTTADIAMIMGLTPATVEKHLRLAREALNAETTAQAVLKASFQNQIFVISA